MNPKNILYAAAVAISLLFAGCGNSYINKSISEPLSVREVSDVDKSYSGFSLVYDIIDEIREGARPGRFADYSNLTYRDIYDFMKESGENEEKWREDARRVWGRDYLPIAQSITDDLRTAKQRSDEFDEAHKPTITPTAFKTESGLWGGVAPCISFVLRDEKNMYLDFDMAFAIAPRGSGQGEELLDRLTADGWYTTNDLHFRDWDDKEFVVENRSFYYGADDEEIIDDINSMNLDQLMSKYEVVLKIKGTPCFRYTREKFEKLGIPISYYYAWNDFDEDFIYDVDNVDQNIKIGEIAKDQLGKEFIDRDTYIRETVEEKIRQINPDVNEFLSGWKNRKLAPWENVPLL